MTESIGIAIQIGTIIFAAGFLSSKLNALQEQIKAMQDEIKLFRSNAERLARLEAKFDQLKNRP